MKKDRFYVYKKKWLVFLFKIIDFIGYLFFVPLKSLKISAKNIIVIRLDQLGDIFQTISAIRSLRHSFPDSKITFLTTSIGAQANAVFNLVDEVFVWDCPWFDRKRKPSVSVLDVWKWLRKKSFDCSLEFRGDIRLILLLRLAGIRAIVGHGATGGGFLLNVEVPWSGQRHSIDLNLDMVRSIGGEIINDTSGGGVTVDFSGEFKKIAIHPDAGTSAKKWPPEYFVKVMRSWVDTGYRLVLVGLDSQLGIELLKNFPERVENKMGQTTLEELVDILRGCSGLLTNDSGPAHIMATLGKPVWILWSGTADPNRWAPRGKNITLFQKNVPCAPCSSAVCFVPGHPCLVELKPETVLSGISLPS